MNTTDKIYFNPIWDVRITDTSLRDGSHHKRHQFSKDEVRAIVAALDAAGVPVIEVTHGDGLGGSSFNYGFSKTPEQELIKLAADTAREARIAFLMLPGVGTTDDIKEAQNNGGVICRIATHCTEADVSIQHFGLARELGLETVGFLMMSHTIPPEKLAAQARIMANAGCQCVYVVDSAGALVLEGVRDRVAALVAELGNDAQVGFHGHENLGLGVANSVEAVRAGARQIDGSVRRFGAGAGNAPVEALIGVFDKIGVKTGIDFFDIADAAEDVVRPAMPSECLLDRNALIMGYSGVYSSFLKHAVRQAERYGVPAHQLLHRAGQRKLIGGQEDQLIDIALEIKREQAASGRKPSHTSFTASAKAAVMLSRVTSIHQSRAAAQKEHPMTTLSRLLLAGGLLSAAASVLVALPSASPASAACDQTVGNSIDSYLKRHPDLHQQLQAKSEAEGGGPNVIDYLNRHPDERQHLIDLSQQCAP